MLGSAFNGTRFELRRFLLFLDERRLGHLEGDALELGYLLVALGLALGGLAAAKSGEPLLVLLPEGVGHYLCFGFLPAGHAATFLLMNLPKTLGQPFAGGDQRQHLPRGQGSACQSESVAVGEDEDCALEEIAADALNMARLLLLAAIKIPPLGPKRLLVRGTCLFDGDLCAVIHHVALV